MNTKNAVNESHDFNILKKVFFNTIAAELVGRSTGTAFCGSQQEVSAINEALAASKDFHDELNRPDATVDSVISKLGAKHISALNFEKVLGIPWPL